MKTTTIAIVNAIKAGIEANFAPTDQEAELEKASEFFLDLAMGGSVVRSAHREI